MKNYVEQRVRGKANTIIPFHLVGERENVEFLKVRKSKA
jgi:hypothetical protein